MVYEEKELKREYVFKGKVIQVRVDEVQMPNGAAATREVVEHNGGVGVIPIDENEMVTFVRQYRHPIGKDMLEIPAGKLAKDEEPFACGVRELKEETGLCADKLVYLCGFSPTPGYSCETIHLYLATGLKQEEQALDEDEFLNIEKYPLKRAVEMAMQGEITDGKTMIALLMADHIMKHHQSSSEKM